MAKNEINKARYWNGILYQENMRPDWREVIDDVVQLPYAYCEHTLDVDSKSAHRKDHVHMILVFPNTTTKKHVISVFNLLSVDGKTCCSTAEACISIRRSYDYLIHDTDSARKAGKYQYPPESRVTGNTFDIGAYEQVSVAEKQSMLKELVEYIICEGFQTINDFTVAAMREYDAKYWDVIVSYNGILERYCAGNYKNMKRKLDAQEAEDRKAARDAVYDELADDALDNFSGRADGSTSEAADGAF